MQLQLALEKANGRRRVRTLGEKDCCRACLDVLLEESTYVFYHGGHVANSYKYPAYATAFLVRQCSDGVVRFIVKEVSAKKGSTGMGEHIRGNKLTASCDGTIITLGEVVLGLTQQEFAENTPKYILLDFLVEKGFITPEKASLLSC